MDIIILKSVAPLIKELKLAHLIISRSDVTPQIALSSPRKFLNDKKTNKQTTVPKSLINFTAY